VNPQRPTRWTENQIPAADINRAYQGGKQVRSDV